MHVLVTGATGLVGRRLLLALKTRGDTVTAISRRGGEGYVQADPAVEGPWLAEVTRADAVVHLAGAGVFDKRWSLAYKAEILHSRVTSTAILAAELAKNPTRMDGTPKTFISASAVGYYGNTTAPCPETAGAGRDFLADVCVQWETVAIVAKKSGVRVAHPRIGIVLDSAGGALPRMARPFKFFMGGPVGTGKQGVSWVHHEDLTRMLLFALDTPKLEGAFNATAPTSISNKEFAKALGKALHKPSWLPVPRLALRVLLGEGANVIVGGQYAIPEVLLQNGFHWNYGYLDAALKSVFTNSPKS